MGIWDPMEPGEIRDVSNRENMLLEQFYVFDSRLQESEKTFYNRLHAIKGGWRDWRLMVYLSRKLMRGIFNTLPDVRLRQYDLIQKYGYVKVDINKVQVTKQSTGMICATNEDFNVIANYAFQNECSMCLKDGKEIKQCELRRALINCQPPRVSSQFGCEYREMYDTLIEMEEKEHDRKD